MIIDKIKNSHALQKNMADAIKNNTLAVFLKEIGYEGTAAEFLAAFYPHDGELSDNQLDVVAGGTDGYNPGWAYGPCLKCPGTRYVMQLDYKNIIACPSCGDWVEF